MGQKSVSRRSVKYMRVSATENKSQISAAHLTRSLSLLGTKTGGGGEGLQMFFTVDQMISVTTWGVIISVPRRRERFPRQVDRTAPLAL